MEFGKPIRELHDLPRLRGRHDGDRDQGLPHHHQGQRTSTTAVAASPAARTVSRSPGTTSRLRRSSASWVQWPCTATTASCTRSASWWPGWWRCCWSRSRCGTPASSRWPMCSPSGCGNAPYALLPPPPRWRSPSSICSPRWPVPAVWWHCCSASRAAVGQSLVIAVVGFVMIAYVMIGGMKGTTWVQIVKAVLLIIGAVGDDGMDHGPEQLQPVRLLGQRRGHRRTRDRPTCWTR